MIGGGDFDRRQGWEHDVLPYAVGRKVVVLRATGARAYAWDAPSRVTALESDPGLLLVAVEDGRIFVLEEGTVVRTYLGTTAATSVGLHVEGVAAQRGRNLELVSSDESTTSRTLRAGERAVFGAGWGVALLYRGRIRVTTLGDGTVVANVAGTTAALDNWRFTYASGRRVTTRLLPSP